MSSNDVSCGKLSSAGSTANAERKDEPEDSGEFKKQIVTGIELGKRSFDQVAELSPKSEPEELLSRFDARKRRKNSNELEFEAKPYKLQ